MKRVRQMVQGYFKGAVAFTQREKLKNGRGEDAASRGKWLKPKKLPENVQRLLAVTRAEEGDGPKGVKSAAPRY